MPYQLRVISGEPANGVFPLQDGENLVGRAADCAVVFDSAGVSRQHFVVRVEGDHAVLENRGRFGTIVDEQEAGEKPIELWPGSKIRFGMYMLVQFEEAGAGGSSAPPADPERTVEMPANYQPPLKEEARPKIGVEDSFFLRNDDISPPEPALEAASPPPAPPAPARPEPPPPKPEKPNPPPAPADLESQFEDGLVTDPSVLEFTRSRQRPSQPPPPRPQPKPPPKPPADDSGIFSTPLAVPAASPMAPGRGAAPPKAGLPPRPAPPPMDDANHTRGLSPEAIAFMRQEWERKARGRNLRWILVVLAVAGVAAVVVWFLYFR